MLTLSEDDARRIAARLKRWSERPIGATNLKVAGICVVTFAMMMVAAGQTPEPAAAVRSICIMFIVMQSAAHLITLGMLRALTAFGIAEAATALASYRDPRRVSGLDLAIMWVALAVAAPLLVE